MVGRARPRRELMSGRVTSAINVRDESQSGPDVACDCFLCSAIRWNALARASRPRQRKAISSISTWDDEEEE